MSFKSNLFWSIIFSGLAIFAAALLIVGAGLMLGW